jgi:hypothetical protein
MGDKAASRRQLPLPGRVVSRVLPIAIGCALLAGCAAATQTGAHTPSTSASAATGSAAAAQDAPQIVGSPQIAAIPHTATSTSAKPTHSTSASPSASSSAGGHGSSGGTSPTPSSSAGGSGSGSSGGTSGSDASCQYTPHSTANVNGYTVTDTSSTDGNPASFSVKLNANSSNKNVIGFPATQCLLYNPVLPSDLTSSYSITPPANSSGLDYEFAYDIWINTPANLRSSNVWTGQTEIMYWVYNNGQRPATATGSPIKTLADGSKLWICPSSCDNYPEPIISIVAPSNTTSGTLNIAKLVNEVHSLGYDTAQTGIIDVEFGIEAPYGGGQMFKVNSLSLAG